MDRSTKRSKQMHHEQGSKTQHKEAGAHVGEEPQQAEEQCPHFFLTDKSSKSVGGKPFGKAQRAVEDCLRASGWAQKPFTVASTSQSLASNASLVFVHPRSMVFSMHCSSCARFRQLSEACTRHLDDKRDLCINISAAGFSIIPQTFPTLSSDLINQLLATEETVERKHAQPHWFLKHRLDSARPRVHPFASISELKRKLEEIGERAWPWYVLQKEVWPPLLLNGRKFVLRAHVFIHQKPGEKLRVYVHSAPGERFIPSEHIDLVCIS
jgi:hypothetical protein